MAFDAVPEFAAGACVNTGADSERVTGTMSVDENFLVTTNILFRGYPGSTNCGGAAANGPTASTSFMDATDSSFTEWTSGNNMTVVRAFGDLEISASTIRFVRAECALDLTECANDVSVLEMLR